ncbi:alginate export family protein [Variovorax sp. GT1P44]|uniref:alginate export family protein n=1 Tax=Variovorax sp. GT1P44 TaxID=3443742 RepID=UPI003F44F918
MALLLPRSCQITARAICAAAVLSTAGPARAERDATQPAVVEVTRPKLQSNRWQEDWSVLADPALRTEPLDGLKYISLSTDDPQRYVSFGLSLRERLESNNAPSFGVGSVRPDSYLLQRLEVYIDVNFDRDWRVFTQLEDARAFAKQSITPVDQNPLDLRLGFLEYRRKFDNGTFKFRIGRQDFAFDLQRFVSSRDGPNVRQSFDAVWADWESGNWRFIGFVSQPVLYAKQNPFDDSSDRHFRFDTLRVERHVFGDSELSAYYGFYQRDNAHYLFASGNERRHVLDARFAGSGGAVDWDVEAMGQTGSVGTKSIRAWAFGERTGYTFRSVDWQPRFGLQADAASGNTHPDGHTLGTFNPLFPNGSYFTLAGYTGYTNLLQLKPSITLKPASDTLLMAAVGFQWRQTTQDAVYVQPNVPVAGTAGKGGRWTGAYAQIRVDYVFGPHLAGAIEAVRYEVGSGIRQAGGHNSNYLGIELRFGW